MHHVCCNEDVADAIFSSDFLSLWSLLLQRCCSCCSFPPPFANLPHSLGSKIMSTSLHRRCVLLERNLVSRFLLLKSRFDNLCETHVCFESDWRLRMRPFCPLHTTGIDKSPLPSSLRHGDFSGSSHTGSDLQNPPPPPPPSGYLAMRLAL